MKIKKVDDKPMVIHTKKKAKIHMHEPKKAKIKGSNIYTVQRGPKIASAKINDTGKKKSYRKSTIHQAEKKEKEPSKFKRNIRESNTSIKTKNTNLHIAGRTGALATGAVTEQVEGGQEVSQAAYLAYEASRPVTGTASRGASLFRKKAAAEAKRRIKKVETGKKLAKKMGKKAASDTAKKVAGDTTKTAAKETAKNTAKETAKTTTKAATTAAGTAVAPGAGTAVGMAAGYATGVSIEAKDVKAANRSRKIKFFLDKMKEQENQTDSVVKLVKDLIVKKAVLWIKAAAPIIGLVLFLLVLLVVIVAVPVIAVIAILYNSPFALFLPPLESGDTVQTVTSAYVSEFNRDVNTKVNEHTGYDFGELVYVDYEGMDENPSNYYDIMAVYMVKYGVGDTATIMNDISKGWLQTVVNDMCSYTTSSGTKDVEETDADGNVTTVTKSVLYVNVTLKSYRDMISVYGFDSDQVEMLEQTIENWQRGRKSSLGQEVRMDLKDMILVMENYKGTERNMLMTLEDYKKFVAIDDMSELADQMLLLGRTLAEGFTEYYRAANVTVFAKFCRDDVELGRFLQGYYNDSKKFYFDKATSSPECITKMDEIGMTDRGWIDDFILHYEKCDRTFERGQTFHNFNDHDYMVLEALSPRNLVVMDMKSGSLTIALGATEYKRYPKDEEPTKDNTTIGVSWEHGIYLGSTLSQTNFKAYKREYGTPEKIKDVYDYRAKLKQKFYFYQDLSKDDDIPKNMQNDFLHQMYKEFGTIEEEYFYDRLEDGKYDEGFKERQVKEKKSR